MKRRTFLKRAGIISAGVISAPAMAKIRLQADSSCRYVLRGANVFVQNTLKLLDVGILPTGRLLVSEAGRLNGNEIIDVTGKIVSPGFIDILADNAANPEKTYRIFEKYKVTDGVTTALQMHGGSADCASYYKYFNGVPHAINFGVSASVMRIRYATSSLDERKRRVEKCLAEGALGVSHSIEYQPTSYEETLAYARLAAKYDRTFFLHLRYSSREQELEGVEEAVRFAKDAGVKVHIDHLHSTGGTYHMKEALDKIRTANRQGLRMTCCVYPYSYWATYLHSKRFDEGWQQRYGLTYNDLRLVGTGERLTKESFARYRAQHRLAAVPEGTLPLAETVDRALKEDFCMIGSDGGIEYEPHANSHPRGAGCFATTLHHSKELGIPLEKILSKVTTLPASLVANAMKGRGVIESGAWADLTVFDPEEINGTSTVENPNSYSTGIQMVFVNGKPAYRDGKVQPGQGVGIRY